jgi:hypothetical protein
MDTAEQKTGHALGGISELGERIRQKRHALELGGQPER